MQTQIKERYYSPQEYLELEEAVEYKSEYIDGKILPITGGSINHNCIIVNLATYLKFALRGKGYEIFTSDVRAWIPSERIYTYPDVMVISGQPVMHENRTDTVTNPLMIAEVLSKSTKNYDQGDKFDYYRSIPECREYVLINQYKFHVQHYAKTPDGKWLLTDYESADSVLALSAVEFQIQLSDIYESVNFEMNEE